MGSSHTLDQLDTCFDNTHAIAGLLWTAVSPRVAFGYVVAWMMLAFVGLHAARGRSPGP
jgi:hypothetical protein